MKYLCSLLALGWMATACGPDEPTCPTKTCEDYEWQQDAQAAMDADPDCLKPVMDTNNDNIACEGLPRRVD